MDLFGASPHLIKLVARSVGVHILMCELHALVGMKQSRWSGAAVLLVVQIVWVSRQARGFSVSPLLLTLGDENGYRP